MKGLAIIKRFYALMIILIWGMIGSFAFHSAALAVHQGRETSQALQLAKTEAPSIDDGSCMFCTALHTPVEPSPTLRVLNCITPLVSLVVSQNPIDPKENIIRTCDARGPPFRTLTSQI